MTLPGAPIDSNRADGSGCTPDVSSATRAARCFQHVGAGVALVWSALASAQELEPRAYSATPIGTNFVVASYARSSGEVSLDPSLPITDLQAKINLYTIGYSHSFGIAGRTASLALLVPYADANLTGNVEGKPGHAYRAGLGDDQDLQRTSRYGLTLSVPRERNYQRERQDKMHGADIEGEFMNSPAAKRLATL